MGDFNRDDKDQNINNVMESYSLKNIAKAPICFQSDRPKTIDLIFTNRTSNFQNTTSIETGLSDFHCMIATVVKVVLAKRALRSSIIETIVNLIFINLDMILMIASLDNTSKLQIAMTSLIR